jgi:hypothetical protein
MSAFSPFENQSFKFEGYVFEYIAPCGSETTAFFKVRHNSTEHFSQNITDNPLGIRCHEGAIEMGVAEFSEGSMSVELNFSLVPANCSFKIDQDSTARVGGIGIEDVRDAGFRRGHHFWIDQEPINIWFNTDVGRLTVETRDPDTRDAIGKVWYETSQIARS